MAVFNCPTHSLQRGTFCPVCAKLAADKAAADKAAAAQAATQAYRNQLLGK